jgi:preprotein translocase subunit SecE
MADNDNKQQSNAVSTTKNAFNLFSGIIKFIKKVMSKSEAAEKK